MAHLAQLPLFAAREAPPRPTEGVLVVLPDGPRVAELVAGLLGPRGFVSGRPACTFGELERALVEGARARGACPRLASSTEVLLAFRAAAREATPAGSPFAALAGRPGYAEAIRGLSRVLAQARVPPEELARLAGALPEGPRARIAALAHTVEAARRLLARGGVCEAGVALGLALEAFGGELALPDLLAGVSQLRFQTVLDWPPLRLFLVQKLATRLARVGGSVEVELPYWPDRPHLVDEALGQVLRGFEAWGESENAPELSLVTPPVQEPLRPFLDRLFDDAAPALEAPLAAPVLLLPAASPAAEARAIAARCAELLAEGAPPEQLAVVARTLSVEVVDALGAALDRLRVPWRERRGRPAAGTAPARVVTSLFTLAERGFPREELCSLLGAPELELRQEGERLGGTQLARWLREARVRDDRQGGLASRLGLLGERLRAQAAQAGADEAARARHLRDAAQVDETLARVGRVVGELRALPAVAPCERHAQALRALLQRWRFFEPERPGLGAEAEGPLGQALLAATARDTLAIRAVDDALRQLSRAARTLGRERVPLSRREFVELLESALSELSLLPGGARGGAVSLVELRELAGRRFSHVLVVGLVDGVLPAGPTLDPLLSDEDKRALNRAAGCPLFRAPPSGDALVLPPRQAEEPLAFLLALGAAQETLTLSWPRADGAGRELVRSTFADAAARALGLPPQALSGLAVPLQPIPAVASCASEGELLSRATLEAFAEPAWRVTRPLDPAATRELSRRVLTGPLRERFLRATRAALAERERLRAFVGEVPPGRFSGQLSGEALALAAPLFRFDAAAPLSASRLEDAASCRFRMFGKRVLGLEEADEPDDDLLARDRGTLLHDILECFYRELRAHGLLPLLPADRGALLARLERVAAERMELFARTGPVGHRGLWELRKPELASTAREVVLADLAAEREPLELERKFGPDADWPAVRLPSANGSEELVLRGAIDRVDRAPSPDGRRSLLVLDYKSRSREGLQAHLKPATWLRPHFQLLVYALAARAQEPLAHVDAAFYSLKGAQLTQTLQGAAARKGQELDLAAVLALDPAQRARNRAADPDVKNLADAAWEIVDDLRAGRMPVLPLDCEHCELRPVCRLVALPKLEEEGA